MKQEEKFKDDVRTKNEIIAFVEQSIHRGGGTPIPQEQENKWIAGLEKQGEPLNESVYDTEDKEIYQAISIGLTDVFNKFGWSDFGGVPIEEIQEWLEKQGEPLKNDE